MVVLVPIMLIAPIVLIGLIGPFVAATTTFPWWYPFALIFGAGGFGTLLWQIMKKLGGKFSMPWHHAAVAVEFHEDLEPLATIAPVVVAAFLGSDGKDGSRPTRPLLQQLDQNTEDLGQTAIILEQVTQDIGEIKATQDAILRLVKGQDGRQDRRPDGQDGRQEGSGDRRRQGGQRRSGDNHDGLIMPGGLAQHDHG